MTAWLDDIAVYLSLKEPETFLSVHITFFLNRNIVFESYIIPAIDDDWNFQGKVFVKRQVFCVLFLFSSY